MQILVNGEPVCAGILPLGNQGETGVTVVTADVSAWLARWPEGEVALQVTDPGQSVIRTADTTVAEGVLTWVITGQDTRCAGYGAATLKITEGGCVKKAEPYVTQVVSSLEEQ